ncbi:MAG TPA: hypothetical protein VLR27_00970 [Acidimicrobiales bacterium]|nr:hypothetical protein [Acidimicrobiales bacterium]
MAKAGAWLIAVGLSLGALSTALYVARQGELTQGRVPFDASPYVIWGGIAGVAVTCGTVLIAAAQVIVALGTDDAPPPRTRESTNGPRSHYE